MKYGQPLIQDNIHSIFHRSVRSGMNVNKFDEKSSFEIACQRVLYLITRGAQVQQFDEINYSKIMANKQ